MGTNYEIVEYNNELPMKLFIQRIGSVSDHWHHSLEILFVLYGEMNLSIGSNAYCLKEDDIILINPDQVHKTYSLDCILIALQIDLSAFSLSSIKSSEMVFDCNSTLYQDQKNFSTIKKIIAQMAKLNDSSLEEQQQIFLNYSLAYRLIHELVSHFRATSPSIQVPGTSKSLNRIKEIINYLDQHFCEKISLADIANNVFLSPTYLSTLFEKNMGVSIMNYLNNRRLEHSLNLLGSSDCTIEELADQTGFSSPRSYSDAFRKLYGMLPSQYKKLYLSKQNSHLFQNSIQTDSYLKLAKYSYLDKLAEYLNDEDQSSIAIQTEVTDCQIGIIDVKNNGVGFTRSYKKFCSVGRAQDILQTEIQDMLRIQQKEIGFEYIKFHGLLDDALMVYREDFHGNPIFNFTLIDRVIDFLLSINLKPFLQLSFMPRMLAKNPERTFFAIPLIISEPKDNEKWQTLITKLTNHLLERYGQSQVRTWIFSFWNEASSNLPFDFDSFEIFTALYKLTYESIKRCDNQLIYGNTSYTDIHYPSKAFMQFLEFAQANHCMPDVYIFHFYPMETSLFELVFSSRITDISQIVEKYGFSLSPDENLFHKYLNGLNANLPNREKMPLYITEWNLSPSHTEWLNDTCFSSAYIVRNILQNYQGADSFCHWSLTDALGEVDATHDLFSGGMGFFTYNGIKKPAYYAYWMINQLEETVIGSGEGYFITTGKSGYVMLLYNYSHYSLTYSKGITFDVTYINRYNAIPSAVAKRISFTLSQMNDGEYETKEILVNQKYGSAFDLWVAMGATPLNKEEAESLKSLSVPMIKKTREPVTNGQYSYSAVLDPHEIRLIHIRPLQ